MKNYDYWKKFVSSGKIDDYLNYIACTREECSEELTKGVELSMRRMDCDKEGGGDCRYQLP